MTNVYYVTPKDDEHRKMLIEQYEMLGYYTRMVGGRLRVDSRRPPKPKKKEEKRPDARSESRTREESVDKRDRRR